MGGSGRKRSWSEPEFEIAVEEPRQTGAWTRVFQLKTLAPLLAPERVAVFRRHYLEFLAENGGKFQLVWGRPRPRESKRFGLLDDGGPGLTDASDDEAAASDGSGEKAVPKRLARTDREEPIDPADAKIPDSSSSGGSRRRRRGSRRRTSSEKLNLPAWVLWVPLVVALAALRACVQGM
jgi:hypothetical protein